MEDVRCAEPFFLTAVATLATAALALASPIGQAAQATASASHGVSVARACAASTEKDVMACNALQVTAGSPSRRTPRAS